MKDARRETKGLDSNQPGLGSQFLLQRIPNLNTSGGTYEASGAMETRHQASRRCRPDTWSDHAVCLSGLVNVPDGSQTGAHRKRGTDLLYRNLQRQRQDLRDLPKN